MTPERWEQIKELVKTKFGAVEQKVEDIMGEGADGPVKQGSREILEVETPVGTIRLAWETRPKVLDKKFHYTHRQGATATTEYTFSDTEQVHALKMSRLNDSGGWEELDESKIGQLMQ